MSNKRTAERALPRWASCIKRAISEIASDVAFCADNDSKFLRAAMIFAALTSLPEELSSLRKGLAVLSGSWDALGLRAASFIPWLI